ncbi:MAG TPA: ABC transporter substrate-binding protein [archaeon]|nr:ABC transporter substrate-binding protein [archaeon]
MKNFGFLIVAAFVATLVLTGCVSSVDSTNPKAAIGLQITPTATPILVADEKGFFKDNGVDVEIKEFTAGKFALQAMLANSIDFASPAEVPVLLAKSQGNDLYVLAEIASNKSESPLVVKDDGSLTVQEYFVKKRKIATSIGGSPEFSLYMFMRTYSVPKENIEIIAQKPEEMVGALSSGSVDGVVIFEPYPSLAEKNVSGLKVFKLPDGVYSTKYLLVGNKHFVDNNPETAARIMKALAQAEEFINSNPEETKIIVAKRTKFDVEIINKIWPDFEFALKAPSRELEQNWHNQFVWAVDTNKTRAVSEPEMEETFRADLVVPV